MRQWKTGDHVFTQGQVDALHAMCGLPKARCITLLKDHGGDVSKTLAALIDKGVVRASDLDPDTVPDHLFARAGRCAQEAAANKVARRAKGWAKLMPAELQDEFVSHTGALASSEAKRDDVDVAAMKTYSSVKRRDEALKKKPVVLKLPPFPPLTLSLGDWVGADVLKAWAGFGAKRGSRGKVHINIARPLKDRDDANPLPPAKEMVAAYAHLKEHEVEVRDAVLAAFQSYINDALIGQYGWDNEQINDPKELKRMLDIRAVHLMACAKKGMSYLGLFFHCTWDEEHAAGALLHGSRVVKVGDSEAAGDEVAATEDGGKRLRPWKR